MLKGATSASRLSWQFSIYLFTPDEHWYAIVVSQKVKIVAFYRSRQWLRSMLQSGGGSFLDVFRIIHPDRLNTCI